MNSFLNRANTIVFNLVMALVILAATSNLVNLFPSPAPYVEIHNPTVVEYGGYHYHSNSPYNNVMRHTKSGAKSAILKFDLDVELSKLFTWNTKQVFIYIVAEYTTSKHVTNQIVIWDTVVDTYEREDADFLIEGLEAKYPLNDVAGDISKADVTLSVHWEVTPILGVFSLRGGKELHSANLVIKAPGKV
jgi:signal peptidase complex subunit 3